MLFLFSDRFLIKYIAIAWPNPDLSHIHRKASELRTSR